jgi:ribonuclease-3
VKLSADLKGFSARLGHAFRDPGLLVQALTHASVASPTRPDNQRLEFLGDRVLGLAIAGALLEAFPEAAEGQLAPRFNALVRKETCAEVARGIGLGEVLKLGRSEMLTGGRKKDALLGDAMEAVIAAVFLDGGFAVARAVILSHWGPRVSRVAEDARDPKSALQEWVQARGLPLPDYVETGREGPDHAPRFTVDVRLSTGQRAQAHAKSKRLAEQEAAKALLGLLEDGDG